MKISLIAKTEGLSELVNRTIWIRWCEQNVWKTVAKGTEDEIWLDVEMPVLIRAGQYKITHIAAEVEGMLHKRRRQHEN